MAVLDCNLDPEDRGILESPSFSLLLEHSSDHFVPSKFLFMMNILLPIYGYSATITGPGQPLIPPSAVSIQPHCPLRNIPLGVPLASFH